MINNCEYSGGGYCMCDICQAVKKAKEEAEGITQEEIEKIFYDAKKLMEQADTE